MVIFDLPGVIAAVFTGALFGALVIIVIRRTWTFLDAVCDALSK